MSRGEKFKYFVIWKASNVALTHSNGSLSCARLASDQYCPASNVTIFDHLQNDPCCPTGGQLANHALGHLAENRNRYPSSHTLMHITLYWNRIQQLNYTVEFTEQFLYRVTHTRCQIKKISLWKYITNSTEYISVDVKGQPKSIT